VDVTGQLLSTFSDVTFPRHLSLDSQGHVLVADSLNYRILLLNNKLQRLLIDTNSEVKLQAPWRLCYNGRTSHLNVLYGNDVVSASVYTEAD